MTESDKTGEKLAASIRKTRAGSTGRNTATTTRKAAPKRAPDTDAEKSTTTKPVQKDSTPSDPYRHGQRVWPD
jgi:hypothetical protein